MEAFQVDFAMNREHEMILDRSGGIGRADLDEIALNMLQSAAIPGLLPVEWMEMDGKMTFRYRITGRKILKHRLQAGPFEMEHYCALLLGIVEALDECRHYMLRAEHTLLSEQYLFVGERWNDVALVYVPLSTPFQAGISLRSSLLSLAVRWSVFMDDRHGADLKRVLQAIEQTGGSWHGLRTTLLRLAGSFPVAKDGAYSPLTAESGIIPVPKLQRSGGGEYYETGEEGQLHEAELPLPQWNGNEFKDLGDADASEHGEISKRGESLPHAQRGSSRTKWIYSLAVAAAVSLPWKLWYGSSASNQRLLVCLGLSLLAGAVLFFIWRKKDAGNRPLQDGFSGSLLNDDEFLPSSQPLDIRPARFNSVGQEPAFGNDFREHADKMDFSLPDRNPALHPADSSSYASPAESRGQGASEATVWLGKDEGQVDRQGGAAYCLVREDGGRKQRVLLEGTLFQIGRAPEAVQHCDESPGISRIHLEIEMKPDGCHARDLGSRNGTSLNGKAMVPYKMYKLQNGDVLQLAGAGGPRYELAAV